MQELLQQMQAMQDELDVRRTEVIQLKSCVKQSDADDKVCNGLCLQRAFIPSFDRIFVLRFFEAVSLALFRSSVFLYLIWSAPSFIIQLELLGISLPHLRI